MASGHQQQSGSLTCLTFLGDDDAQQRTSRRDGFVEVVIVVDGQQVSVDVGVAQLHLRTGDAVDGSEKDVEVQVASRAVSLQTKAAIFCLKLVTVNSRTRTEQNQVTRLSVVF